MLFVLGGFQVDLYFLPGYTELDRSSEISDVIVVYLQPEWRDFGSYWVFAWYVYNNAWSGGWEDNPDLDFMANLVSYLGDLYNVDLSRTFVLGEPTDKMRQVFDIELRAQTAALAAAAPGVECQAVDAAARRVIEDAGYGPGYAYFTHRVGHGMGMDGHEWPYLVKGNTLLLESGMTFSDEPGIYIRGEFGVRLEDDMVITTDGAELFTPQSPSLDDPFADVR
jgi:hypothetical protein